MTYPEKVPQLVRGGTRGQAQIFGTPKLYSFISQAGGLERPKCWGRGEQMGSRGGNKKGLGS